MATTPENANKKLKKEDYTKPALKPMSEVTTADGASTVTPEKKINTDALGMFKQKKEPMKQVNNFGKSFPMLRPDEAPHLNPMEAVKTPEIVNRAAGPQDRNVLIADQRNPQPPQKIAASGYQRDQMFNNMASSQGQMNPASTTPQVQTFPPQQGMASYSSPNKINNTTADEIAQGGKNIQESMQKAGEAVKKSGEKSAGNLKRVIAGVATGGASEVAGMGEKIASSMYNDEGPGFNKGIKNAMEGETGAFADMVAAAPASFDSLVSKLESEGKSKESATKIAGSVANAKMKGAGSGPTAAQKARANSSGMYGDHKHTKITKGNVNAARKDDKAHIDYLKRDINYDAKHGGSDKNMTADEKHISKLAGDIKYDTHKKRKYDNV